MADLNGFAIPSFPSSPPESEFPLTVREEGGDKHQCETINLAGDHFPFPVGVASGISTDSLCAREMMRRGLHQSHLYHHFH